MKFRSEKHVLRKAEELAFLRIKDNAEFNLKGYNFPSEGLDVPIKNDVLVSFEYFTTSVTSILTFNP